MPDVRGVSIDRHSTKKWSLKQSFEFAKDDVLIAINSKEAIDAHHSLPIAFTKFGDEFKLIAIVGLLKKPKLTS